MLTAERQTPYIDSELVAVPVAAATVIFLGAIVCLNASGYAVPGQEATGLVCLGRAEQTVNNSAGAAGDLSVLVRRGKAFGWANSALDPVGQAQVGRLCYLEDDQTVSATSNSGARSIAGLVVSVTDDLVYVLPLARERVELADGEVDADLLAAGAVVAAKLGAAAVTGAKTHADNLTPWVVTGADASGGAQDLAASGAVAGLRIAAVIDLTTPAVVTKSTITAGADKFVQATGNLANKKLLVLTLPAAA